VSSAAAARTAPPSRPARTSLSPPTVSAGLSLSTIGPFTAIDAPPGRVVRSLTWTTIPSSLGSRRGRPFGPPAASPVIFCSISFFPQYWIVATSSGFTTFRNVGDASETSARVGGRDGPAATTAVEGGASASAAGGGEARGVGTSSRLTALSFRAGEDDDESALPAAAFSSPLLPSMAASRAISLRRLAEESESELLASSSSVSLPAPPAGNDGAAASHCLTNSSISL